MFIFKKNENHYSNLQKLITVSSERELHKLFFILQFLNVIRHINIQTWNMLHCIFLNYCIENEDYFKMLNGKLNIKLLLKSFSRFYIISKLFLFRIARKRKFLDSKCNRKRSLKKYFALCKNSFKLHFLKYKTQC